MKITPRENRRHAAGREKNFSLPAACRLFSRDFHARSRFALSTIPEEKWGTTRSLRYPMFEQPGPVLKSASAYAVQETGRSLIRLCPNCDGWSKQSFTLVCWRRSAPLPSPPPSTFLIYLRCTHNLNAWNRLANRKLPLYSSNDRKPSLSPSTNSRNSYDKITHNFMLVELCGLKTYNRDLERQYSNTFCFPNDKKEENKL